MSREEKLAEFVGWAQQHVTGDEKGQAQIFLDRLFQAFGHPGVLDVGGQIEFRIRKAADYNWTKVQPEIFGTLFQHSMEDEERHALGAHFTHPADIMKIVGPTIVQL